MPGELRELCVLPNGSNLYVRDNEAGGRTYITDECAIGHEVWDTACTDISTLMAAMMKEYEFIHNEQVAANKLSRRLSSQE